jgi:hypothetical protein
MSQFIFLYLLFIKIKSTFIRNKAVKLHSNLEINDSYR